MKTHIRPSTLRGRVSAPASKSVLHRQLIAAALCNTPTVIHNITHCADTDATVDCLQALGAKLEINGSTARVTPIEAPKSGAVLPCRESGSTLRFLIPVAAALEGGSTFTGTGRLPQRPIAPLLQALQKQGCSYSATQLPVTLTGQLKGGTFTLPGNLSSQFVSGLLLAAPLLCEDCTIDLTGKTESFPYIRLTAAVLEQFGVKVGIKNANRFMVEETQKYTSPGRVVCEGDWSNAAFWLVAGALSGEICCENLYMDSAQGDKEIVAILQKFGTDVTVGKDFVTVRPAPLRGCTIDATDIPDLVPILAVLASVAKGETRITGAARLRMKESDRLQTVTDLLTALGADITPLDDGLVIRGKEKLAGGTVSACNDHRIAMSAAVASLLCTGPVTVTGAEAVEKSYPDFWAEFAGLGADVDIYKGE